jgi:hypothetical protein
MSPLKLLSTMIRGTHLFGLSCLLALSPLLHEGSAALAASAQDEARIVQALKQGGVTVLIRHSATDPGTGDPPGFKLSDCATQRNLSDGGREQARRLGQWFKANAIQVTAVRTSPWCRTRETATLAFGRSDDWSALSNLLSDRSRQGDQTKQVREAIAAQTDGAVRGRWWSCAMPAPPATAVWRWSDGCLFLEGQAPWMSSRMGYMCSCAGACRASASGIS